MPGPFAMSDDDATLVELARSGDQQAFAALYERYFDRVYDFLARMVHDSSEAADLTQDAFLRAMNSLGSLTKGASFKSWLFTIARNTALNRLERASRTTPLEDTNDEGEEQRYDVIDEDRFGNPEEAAEASSLASVVWDAAAALDPKYRSVLLLNLREGLDSAEIADVMGVTKNHAYVLVNRMKAALQSAVESLALFRNGRRQCAELDAVIERLQIGELTPEARRAIERHAGSCEVCREQRRKLASPFAIFAGMALVQPGPGIKETIFGGLQEAFAALTPGAGASTTAPGVGADGAVGQPGAVAYNGGSGEGAGGASGAEADAPYPALSGRQRALAIVGGVVVVMLIVAAVAALFMFGGEGSTSLAVIEASPTQTVTTPPSATAVPSVTPKTGASAIGAPTVTPTATGSPTPTATIDPGTPTAIEPGPTEPPLAPGGPTEAPSTPVPAEAGPTEAPLIPPPTAVPDTNAPPGGSGPDLLPPTPCSYSMTTNTAEVVFDASSTSKTFVLTGEGCGEPLAVTLEPGASWIIVTPAHGSVPIGGSLTVTVFVDREDRTADSGRIMVTSTAGSFYVMVTVKSVATVTPTPTIQSLRGPNSGGGNTPTPTVTATPCGVNCPRPPSGPGGLTN